QGITQLLAEDWAPLAGDDGETLIVRLIPRQEDGNAILEVRAADRIQSEEITGTKTCWRRLRRQPEMIQKAALGTQRSLLKRQGPEGAVGLRSLGERQALQCQEVLFTPAPLLLQEIYAAAFQSLL